MKLLIVVSTALGGHLLMPLARACSRNRVEWGCFFTNDGVKLLGDPALVSLLDGASRKVACDHSWVRFMGRPDCPVELGSQTNHSAMVGAAEKILTL
ncbi:MAG: hypothetical protein ACYC0P_10990 [Thiobacillus sp.]